LDLDERSVVDRFDRAAWPPPGSRTRLPTRSLIQSPRGASHVDHSLAISLFSRLAHRAGLVTLRQTFVLRCQWQPERIRSYAAELVALAPDVIVATGQRYSGNQFSALPSSTKNIPIVPTAARATRKRSKPPRVTTRSRRTTCLPSQ